MYILPQEIEVWYVIPAVRKELAKNLIKKHNLTFEKTGNILGISKAAVSQYLSNKRGAKLKLPENIKKEVQKSAKTIVKNNSKAVIEMQRILRMIKDESCSCSICREHNPEIGKFCKGKPIC